MNTDLISRAALLAAYDAEHKGPPGGARRFDRIETQRAYADRATIRSARLYRGRFLRAKR